MNLRRLTSFLAVARARHFGHAAAELHVAPSALSQQVKALEAELGVVLLDRSTRHVELTAAGRTLLDLGPGLVAAADRVRDHVRAAAAGEEGTLRVGAIGSATYELMPRLSRELLAELPGLRVDLHGEMLSHEVQAGLEAGRLDLGLLRPVPDGEGVDRRTLRHESLVLALPQAHPAVGRPVRLRELAGEDFVAYPAGESAAGDAFVAACSAAGFRPRVRVEARQTSTLVALVAAELGVAVVPDAVGHVTIPGVVYQPLPDVGTTVELRVAWRHDAPRRAVEHALVRLRARL